MRTLTDSERRTVRLGVTLAVGYLVLFFGWKGWSLLERSRREYRQLQTEATTLRQRAAVYTDKADVARDLMEKFRMDPARISTNALVADATAAIHQAAMSGGLQLGPIRESPSRGSSRELSAIQLEGFGPVPSVLGFLNALGSLGFPIVTESMDIGPDNRQPGQVKVSLTLLILDYRQWTPNPERPRA